MPRRDQVFIDYSWKNGTNSFSSIGLSKRNKGRTQSQRTPHSRFDQAVAAEGIWTQLICGPILRGQKRAQPLCCWDPSTESGSGWDERTHQNPEQRGRNSPKRKSGEDTHVNWHQALGVERDQREGFSSQRVRQARKIVQRQALDNRPAHERRRQT